MTSVALIVCPALTLIAAIHLYWAAGGTAGKAGAIPSRGGVPVLLPSPFATSLVGVALLGMAVVVGATAGLLPPFLPAGLLRGASAVLALVFAVRAVGEFRYVGFFKRVRGSVFAGRDTFLYSPLCLLLAVLIALVALRPPPGGMGRGGLG